jgi:serine/threonine protein kinase/tetratricopeptide (TPR) repeat protein
MELADLPHRRVGISVGKKRCRSCGATVHLGNGLCLNCLLRDATDPARVRSDRETFNKALDRADKGRPKRRFPNHEMLEEIGRGGMGIVYRAREIRSGRVVGLKCMHAADACCDQLLARFRREAETVARLNHPNIVPVYFVGDSEDGLPFFTMKFAPCGNLHQARPDELRANPRKAVLVILKVALGVQYAHEHGVLHRDLKAANILVDERNEPLVSDFGLAKWMNDSGPLTRTLNTFGTVGHVAPEQLHGSAACLTAAADIYSIGVVLFELLTGELPVTAEDPLAHMDRAEASRSRLRSIKRRLDRDLRTICARCLEPRPLDRYQSCAALASDLQSWLDDRPITARRVSVSIRVGRWIRRDRKLVATIGMVLILLGTSITWQIHSRKLQAAAREGILAMRSVAVIPFLNLDNVTNEPILAESLANSLERELCALGPAKVIKMTTPETFPNSGSVEQVKEIGRSAKARAVLTGTVRTVDGKNRISLQLLDAATAEPLLVQFLDLADKVGSNRIAEGKFSRECYSILSVKNWSELKQSKEDPGLRDDITREAILAGRDLTFRYTANDFDHAIALLKKAIHAQPNSALAHSYLASAATARTHFIADSRYLKIGEEAAAKAIQLAPFSRDAHRALAGVYYQQGRFTNALEEGMQTVESAGLEEKLARFIGMTCDTLGRPDRALGWLSLASRMRGTPGDVDAQIGDCWVKLADDERALAAYIRSQELQPGCAQGAIGICHMRMLEGDFRNARELYESGGWENSNVNDSKAIAAQIEFFARDFEKAQRLYDDLVKVDADGGGAFYGAVTYQSALGRARQATGSTFSGNELLKRSLKQQVDAIQREPENPEAFYRLASVESALGLLDDSLEHLYKAVLLGWIDYRSLDLDPRFDGIRQTLEFQDVVRDLSTRVADMRSKSERN